MRALRGPLPPGVDPERPLAPGDLVRLRRWERRLRGAVAVVGVTYLATAALALAAPEGTPEEARTSLLALAALGLACAAGAGIQFSERCPRCGYNLGFQSRLLLADACERCGGRWE